MPRQKSVESALREAFDRLKNDNPSVLVKGTLVTLTNVAREAEMNPASFRKDRYPELHAQVRAYAEITTAPASKIKIKKTRVSDTKRIKQINKKIEKLTNIVITQTTTNEQLEHENAMLRDGKVKYI